MLFIKQFIIQQNDAGQRLDKFLTKAVKRLPPSLMYKYIRTKRIKRNGRRTDSKEMLAQGDVLELYINDEFFDQNQPELDFLYAKSSLDIVYEDENIILVDKKIGLSVHEDEGEQVDTLINRIKRYLYQKQEYKPQEENSFVPALCNRIDRNTGGIVIAAKNAAALRILNDKIKNRELDKRYLCLVHGRLERQQDTMIAYLKKDSEKNVVEITSSPKAGFKNIITSYRVLHCDDRYSLLEVSLETGRTHQIRAHFAYIGHPLVGDGKYGNNQQDKRAGYTAQALYSYQLTFSFQTDAGILNYLKGKNFRVKSVWFAEQFLGKSDFTYDL